MERHGREQHVDMAIDIHVISKNLFFTMINSFGEKAVISQFIDRAPMRFSDSLSHAFSS